MQYKTQTIPQSELFPLIFPPKQLILIFSHSNFIIAQWLPDKVRGCHFTRKMDYKQLKMDLSF